MSTVTTADEAMAEVRELVEMAREKIGRVLVERKTMWGANDFKPGYVRNIFDRLDALSRAIDGEDAEGNARSARIDSAEGGA